MGVGKQSREMEHEDSECDDLGITRGRGESGETMEWKEQ